SSAPCSEYCQANSTGSPASRRSTKLTPLTVRPSFTSKQGIIRFANIFYIEYCVMGSLILVLCSFILNPCSLFLYPKLKLDQSFQIPIFDFFDRDLILIDRLTDHTGFHTSQCIQCFDIFH